MSSGSELVSVYCPYCGEIIQVIVDLSVEDQDYVEDCSVCCRPIVMQALTTEAGASVTVRSEDE